MLSSLVSFVLVFFIFILFNQTPTHHPSILSLSLPHEMAAGWPIQGVSYQSAAAASGLSAPEFAGKNVGMGGNI